jgi:small subunit ribosomal protein S20
MANIVSQIKRNRQALVRRQRNKAVRSTLKTYQKRFSAAAASGDRESAEQAYREAARKLDKAVSKGVVHANYAANHKSQMAKHLQTL